MAAKVGLYCCGIEYCMYCFFDKVQGLEYGWKTWRMKERRNEKEIHDNVMWPPKHTNQQFQNVAN